MPRACSTLLQNIFNQRPDTYATPTDGVIELLDGCRQRYTHSVEFKASEDQDLMLKSFRNFCKGGLKGYCNTLSDKQNIVLKSRGYKNMIQFINNFSGSSPMLVCRVRDLRSIVASLEKLYRKNPEKESQWYIPNEMRGTTVDKRVDMYLSNIPISISLDQLKDALDQGYGKNFIFIKAEDLTSRPKAIMDELYSVLKFTPFEHDFSNIEQTTHENDVIHGLDNNLHTIRKDVKPLKEDYIEILGEYNCNLINERYEWYQKYFGYIT